MPVDPSTHSDSSTRPSGSSGTALVADADPAIRHSLSIPLQTSGYRVIEVTAGQESIDVYQASKPDIIFIDTALPGLDGYQVVSKIRDIEHYRFVPVIFLSQATDEKSLTLCIDAGGDDFLIKPFSQAVVMAKIRTMEHIRGLHREVNRFNNQIRTEEEMAETVFNSAVIADNIAMEGVRTLQKPAELFSGDVLLSAPAPSGDINLLLGDFTGHGLAAALGALPASEVFRAMTAKGFAAHQILAGINNKLHNLLPTGMFFAVQFVAISHKLEYISVCNCGMPDMLLLDGENGGIKERFSSGELPLGVVPDSDYQDAFQFVKINPGDRILLLSDGVSEARNPHNLYFGQERLEQAINQRDKDETALDSISRALEAFCGSAPQDDDISLAEVPFLPQIFKSDEPEESQATQNDTESGLEMPEPGDLLEFTLTLSGKRLRQADPVPLVINHIQEMEGLHGHRRPLFTILTELYVNALDHGVLKLNSSLKQSPDGFTLYFSEREKRLEALTDGMVRIQINTVKKGRGGQMTIRLEDSGEGFDFKAYQPTDPDAEIRYSGRGILLLRELCDSVVYESPGNRVEAVYSWSED